VLILPWARNISKNLKDADLPNDFEENVVQKISDVLKYPLEVNILCQ
jgi:hypothetical protein